MPRYASYLTRPDQKTPLFGKDQVKNDAGGYVFKLDPFDALDRFLILGCEAGTYYTGPARMTQRAAATILECAKRDAPRTVAAIQTCGRRSIKADPAIFALALLAGQTGTPVSLMALEALNDVCRIGTHLFSFVDQVTQFRGWGRSLRRAVASWYTERDSSNLLYQVTKYKQRGGWSHRDLLRLSHPVSDTLNPVFKYITSSELSGEVMAGLPDNALEYLTAVEGVKTATNVKFVTAAIRKQGLVREHIPTKWLNRPEVWEALLERMPLTAMIRNLGKMTAIGLIAPLSKATVQVCYKLTNEVALKKARVHPFALLLAQTTYAAGCGVRGSLTWTPDPHVLAALEKAFYLSFENVEPSGKNLMLGIDVSGSMGFRGFDHMGSIAGTHIKAYQAAAVMAMAQIKTEPWCFPVAFTGNNTMDRRRAAITPLNNLSDCTSLNEVYETFKSVRVGPTDCAQPMIYAMANKIPVDVFVVYTDNETWCGKVHPSVALNDYRQAMGRDAKLVVCGMTSTDFTIADPNDPGMLDVVGFDASCPAIISNFARGF